MQLLTLKKREKLIWNQDPFIENTLIHKWIKQWKYVASDVSSCGHRNSTATKSLERNRLEKQVHVSFVSTFIYRHKDTWPFWSFRTGSWHTQANLDFGYWRPIQILAAPLSTVWHVLFVFRWFQTSSLDQREKIWRIAYVNNPVFQTSRQQKTHKKQKNKTRTDCVMSKRRTICSLFHYYT